jgi:tetratricopeptide (TPR) repeat protein
MIAAARKSFNKPAMHVLLIALLSILAYSNTFQVPFVFDDTPFILDNPVIKDINYFISPSKADSLSVPNNPDIPRFLKTRPVAYFSFWVNHRIGGLNVEGYHAVNIALHIMNSLLVYLIVLLTFRTLLLKTSVLKGQSGVIALFSGLLFAAHPLQTEAVTYILQRCVVLAAMFYLLSIAAYIGSRLSESNLSKYGLYLLSIVSAVLGMKTKESTFTLPVAIVVYEFLFFNVAFKKRALLLIPLLLTMLIIPLEYIDLSSDTGLAAMLDSASRSKNALPRLDYLLTQFRVIAGYIGLVLFPVGQNADHDQQAYNSFLEPQVFMSFLFLSGIFAVGIYLFYRSRIKDSGLRIIAFGIFLFFLALFVESSVFPIGEMMVEYRVYLSCAGAFLALGTGAFLLMERLKKRAMQKAFVLFLVVIPLALSVATYSRNAVWKSKISLWEDVVRKSPQKERGYNNLGNAYKSMGLFDRAIEHYTIAISLKPDYAVAHNNLGSAYGSMELFDRAIEHYTIALSLDPDYATPYVNLGSAYGSMGLFNKAIEHYTTALSLEPDFVMAYYYLGKAYMAMGLFDKAIEHYTTALSLAPDFAMAHNNLGILYVSIGLFDKAIEHYTTVLSLEPSYTDVHFNFGIAFFEKGIMEEARRIFDTALKINPYDHEARYYLDRINKSQLK